MIIYIYVQTKLTENGEERISIKTILCQIPHSKTATTTTIPVKKARKKNGL